jgi:uroporphyrinogen-III decarboxylase
MNDTHWNQLLAVLNGEIVHPMPMGFIIDCPWLPGWAGMNIADYLTSDELWFEANRKAIEAFPEFMFLPGFWSEFGMCTEPSAFGARCVFPINEFPHAETIVTEPEQAAQLREPNPATDGLLPFMLSRLKRAQPKIEAMGHKIRFSVSRGPLNIATFLMGTTEFLMGIKTDPDEMHTMLRTITRFLKNWHALQRDTFPTIDGTMMLDDIVGFLSEADFLEFGFPYLKEIYDTDVTVKFFHNDAPCAQSLKHYPDMGVNLYNPGIQTSLEDMRALEGGRLTILGVIPPRDVLASGTANEVAQAVEKLLADTASNPSRLILSCAGGMPPDTSTENLSAFRNAARGNP